MISAGLDIGSRTIAMVAMNHSEIARRVIDTGVSPLSRCKELLSDIDYEQLVVTGYGRYLISENIGGQAIAVLLSTSEVRTVK